MLSCFLFILIMEALIHNAPSLSIAFSNKELVGKIYVKTRARSHQTVFPGWWQTVASGSERPPPLHSLPLSLFTSPQGHPGIS